MAGFRFAAAIRLFAIILLAFFAVVAAPARAVQSVLLVVGEHGGYAEEFVTAFEAAIASGGRGVRTTTLVAGYERPAEADPAQVDLVIAVGSQAMRNVAGWSGAPPVLNVLVPRAAFERTAADVARGRPRSTFSALWLDQDPRRLIALFRETVPGGHSLGLLLGPESQPLLAGLREAAARAGVDISSESVGDAEAAVTALGRLLPHVDALLALPDSLVYTRESVRPILLTTYRYRRPLLAFSHSYVSAGALAAVFTTPAMAAQQAADLVRSLPAGHAVLPAPQYARSATVAVNRQVARSLGLELPTDAAIADVVLKAEEEGR